MPVVRYIARHDDLDSFTHGKLHVASGDYGKLMRDRILCVHSDSDVFIHLYRSVLRTYETKGLACKTCGNRRTFVANPVFRLTTDPEVATRECTLRGVVKAGCLGCAFATYMTRKSEKKRYR